MEVQYECVYIDTEAQLRELYAKVMYRKIRKWIVISAILAIVFTIAWIVQSETSYLLGAGLYTYLMVWYLTLPARKAKSGHQNSLDRFNGKLPPSRIRFGDEIQYEDGEVKISWPYRSVKKIHLLSDSIVLEDQTGFCIQFPSNAFVKGTASDLLEFLKGQCPQINLPDWKW